METPVTLESEVFQTVYITEGKKLFYQINFLDFV